MEPFDKTAVALTVSTAEASAVAAADVDNTSSSWKEGATSFVYSRELLSWKEDHSAAALLFAASAGA